MDFMTLDLPEPVMQGIREAGFVTATPIQEAALPLALRGKDVAGQSQTGTGKTAAFLISAFTRMIREGEIRSGHGSEPRVLIIAPTRELVVQIESDARLLGKHTPFRILSVYGGIDYNKQREALAAGCDVLVGTPGRLIDYLKQHIWSPRKVEILVIDEADRMFDMGFIADLRFILRRLPPPERRQSFLFSATLSFRVLELTWEFMNNPSQITIMPQQKTAERVEQTLYHVGREEKFPLLLGLMRREGDRFLIFSNTREEARRLEDRLVRNGWDARALTGDVDQKRRLKIMNDFKEGVLPVLVATDVASRGLHIEAVSHVINWDLPQDPEDYVHRIARRAPDAVDVVLRILGQVPVDHVADRLDVEPARGDVGGHEHGQHALLEVVHDLEPPLLVHVAGDGPGVPAVADQAVLQPPRLLARVREDEEAVALPAHQAQ